MIQLNFKQEAEPNKFEVSQSFRKQIDAVDRHVDQFEQHVAFGKIRAIAESFHVFPCEVDIHLESHYGNTLISGSVTFAQTGTSRLFLKEKVEELERRVEDFHARYPRASFVFDLTQKVIAN